MKRPSYNQGEDAQVISRIAKIHYGGYRNMFVAHGWNSPDDKLMVSAPTLIVEAYGSIKKFEASHPYQPVKNTADVWHDDMSVLFTSLWGWTPETWGAIGFTNLGGETRRANLASQLTDPFICVVYVNSNQTYSDPDLEGKIAGFYLLSHEMGDRDLYTHPIHHAHDKNRWRHSFRALRAFSYLPEYRMSVREFDPSFLKRGVPISSKGEIISGHEKINQLRETPFTEVDCYSATRSSPVPKTSERLSGMVHAGPANKSGYNVAGGAYYLPRELYVMKLVGDTDAYLGRQSDGKVIYKIGLSSSPDLRRQAFQKSMPRGAFNWSMHRTSMTHGSGRFHSFDAAVTGENAMKEYLASCADWLGGEFYLASTKEIDEAWSIGNNAASVHVSFKNED